MSQLCYQHYLGLLEGFISAKETVNAKVYAVIIILKFTPNKSFNPGLDKDVCRYSILLPQNPEQLLNIL